MAKFAQYYLEYIFEDLFAPLYKAERQAHLGALFENNESIQFVMNVGGNEIPLIHEVTHLALNRDIIVMRIANEKTKEVVQGFKKKNIKHEPPSFVIIDNRKNCRRVAIQRNRESFGSTDTLSRILTKVIGDRMHAECNINIKLHPQFYPQDFYKAWRMHQHHTAKLRFGISDGSLSEDFKTGIMDDDGIMTFAQEVREERFAKKYKSVLELAPPEKGAILPVDYDDRLIRNLVNFHAATGAPIELVTTDGSTFHCYIDEDEESNKIITSELDIRMATALFEHTDTDRGKAEEAILQFVNSMKYVVDANEIRATAAEGSEATDTYRKEAEA